MPRILVLTIVTFFLFNVVYADKNDATTDSLEYTLDKDFDLHQRLEIYYSLSNRYLEYKPDKSFEYASKLRDLAHSSGNINFTVQSMLLQCDYYTLIGEYSSAFDLAYEALKLAGSDTELMSNCHNRIASIHSALLNYKESLYHNKKSLQYNIDRGDSVAIMLDIHNIAVDYSDLKLYDSALSYLKQTNDFEIRHTGKPDSYSLSNLGNVYLNLNNLDSALALHKQAYKTDLTSQSDYLICLDEHFLANTYFQMEKYDSAQLFALKSIKGANKLHAYHIALDNYKILYQIKEKKKQFEEAYEYAIKYTSLRDSAIQKSKQAVILKLESNYKVEEQNVKLSALSRQKKLYLVLALISTMFVVSLAVIVFLIYRRQKTYRQLVKELQLSDSSKERLLSIISHDLRGSVGALRTASKAIADGATDLEGTRELMGSFFPVADSVYDLLENLLIWAKCNKEVITPVIEDLNIRELIEKSIEHTYHLAMCKSINIDNNVMPVYIQADRNMMSSIIRNLLSNAVKFSHTKGNVSINQHIIADELIISICDEGIGIEKDSLKKLFTAPEEVQASGTVGERGSGLGLNICKTFLESQGGNIWAESTPGTGTTFFLSIPLTKSVN